MPLPPNPLGRLFWTAYTAYHRRGQVSYPYRPLATIERDRDRRVRQTVAYAYRWVPYYRETMNRLGLRPDAFRTADDLAFLPLLRREQVQRDPAYYVSRQRPLSAYVRRYNSGSTGTPCASYHDTAALCQWVAYYDRLRAPLYAVLGRGHGYRKTSILRRQRGFIGTPNAFYDRVLWLPQQASLQRQALSIFDPPTVNAALINQFQPDVLESSGGYLAALFHYLEASGERLNGPKAVLYTLDPLPEQARQLIQGSYGLPVFGAYEAIEASCLAFECEQHEHYHVNVDLIPLRITDDEGSSMPDGEPGNVVISNLVLRGSMFLNYMLQDIAAWVPVSCACGRSLPLLGRLLGRCDDWLELPSGRKLHPHVIPSLLLNEEGIWQYQVIQESPRRLCVALVSSGDVDRQLLAARIRERFEETFGPEVDVRVDFVQDVQRTARGKVRPVISLQTRGWLERSLGKQDAEPGAGDG